VLLLVCSAVGRLLATMRSRCRRLRLAPLGEADMADLLGRYLDERGEEERAWLATLAEGSPGRALQLAAAGGVGFAEMVGRVMAALPSLPDEQAHLVADALGRSEEAFTTFMDLLRAAVAVAVREAAHGRADPDQARLIGTRPLDAWVDVWQALGRLQYETENFHLDKRQAIVAGFGLLAERS
jgi:DNA polymerase-3 subunit delta'